MGMRKLLISKSITSRESTSLAKYLNEVTKYKLLQPQEEILLAKRIKSGDESALRKLVNSNLRFVISVAKQYEKHGLSLSDLINEGNMGLIKAARRYDSTKGFKFISYAVWWIRQSIMQAIAEQSRLIRFPTNKIAQNSQINEDIDKLMQKYEREPTVLEIASSLKLNEDEILSALQVTVRQISLDAPLNNEDENNLYDLLEDSNCLSSDNELTYTESLRKDIQHILSMLTPRQKEIISDFFGLGMEDSISISEIGRKRKLSNERVRQIKDKAIMKIKNSMLSRKKLLVYLGI